MVSLNEVESPWAIGSGAQSERVKKMTGRKKEHVIIAGLTVIGVVALTLIYIFVLAETSGESSVKKYLSEARSFSMLGDSDYQYKLALAEYCAEEIGLDILEEVREIKRIGSPFMIFKFLGNTLRYEGDESLFYRTDLMLARSYAEDIGLDISIFVEAVEKLREAKEVDILKVLPTEEGWSDFRMKLADEQKRNRLK